MIKIKKDNLNYLFYKFFKLFRKQKIQKQKKFHPPTFLKNRRKSAKKSFSKKEDLYFQWIYIFFIFEFHSLDKVTLIRKK